MLMPCGKADDGRVDENAMREGLGGSIPTTFHDMCSVLASSRSSLACIRAIDEGCWQTYRVGVCIFP